MPIQIACPECGKKLRFADDQAGETVECKACGADVDLPGGTRRRAGNRDRSSSPRKRVRKSSRSSKSSGPLIGLVIGGGIGAVVVIGLLAALMLRRPVANNAPIAANPAGATGPGTANSDSPAGGTQTTAAANPSKVSIKNWKVKVDAGQGISITDPIPSFQIPTRSQSGLSENDVLYPDVRSPFVLVGSPSFSKEPRQLWNLASGTKVKEVAPQKGTASKIGLSPDGKLLAWYRFDNDGGLDVFDIDAGKITLSIPLASSQVNVGSVSAPTPNRLVVASNVHRRLMTWKLPSGEFERTIQLGEHAQPNEMMAYSPGGRYVAFTADYLAQSLQIYDLDSGEQAGLIEFSERMSNKGLVGLEFSPDGAELAAAFGQNHGATSDRILIWNVANGATVADFLLPDPEQRPLDIGGLRQSLQWFPDRKRLLQNGVHIIDRESRSVVYTLPTPQLKFGSSTVRHVLTNSTIVAWDGAKGREGLAPLEVKESEIAMARSLAASGGLIIDAKLPRLSSLDRKKGADKSAISGNWNVQPDPPTAPVTLASSISLADSAVRVRELKFSNLNNGRAVLRVAADEDESKAMMSGIYPKMVPVSDRSRRRYSHEPVTCQKNWLEILDVGQGKSAGRVAIDFPCELLAVSPGGTRVLLGAMGGQGRIDAFSIPEGSPIAGCRPFADAAKVEHRDIDTATFLDENTVAVCSRNDQLVVLKLPSCEPVYTVQDAGLATVSPGGRFLATCAEGKIEFRDPLSGDGRGSVPLTGAPVAMSFSPEGNRLAVVTSAGVRGELSVIDLKDAAITSQSIPGSHGPVIWAGPDQLLIGSDKVSELIHRPSAPSTINRYLMLVSLKRQAVLWSYAYGTGDNLTVSASTMDNRLWVAGAAKKGGPFKLNGLELPEAAVARRIDDKSLDSLLVVKPGMSVSVQINIADPPEYPGLAKQIQDVVDAGLQANGLTSGQGQPVKLVASVTVANAPGILEFQSFGGSAGTQAKVNIQPKTLTARLVYELNGKPVWEAKREISNAGAGLVQVNNKPPQQAVDELMWKAAVPAFRDIQPISHILNGATDKGLGTSQLAGDGAHPAG